MDIEINNVGHHFKVAFVKMELMPSDPKETEKEALLSLMDKMLMFKMAICNNIEELQDRLNNLQGEKEK